MNFHDWLVRFVDEGYEPADAYDAAVRRVRRQDLADHFRHIGVDEARRIRRNKTRTIENRVFGGAGRHLEVIVTEPRIVDVRAILAERRFDTGDGRYVRWDEATVADHQARIDSQKSLAESILKDAEHHERAIKLIRENDVETLGEVDDWSPLTEGEEEAS